MDGSIQRLQHPPRNTHTHTTQTRNEWTTLLKQKNKHVWLSKSVNVMAAWHSIYFHSNLMSVSSEESVSVIEQIFLLQLMVCSTSSWPLLSKPQCRWPSQASSPPERLLMDRVEIKQKYSSSKSLKEKKVPLSNSTFPVDSLLVLKIQSRCAHTFWIS